MIICNIKLNKKAIFKTGLGIMFIIAITIGILSIRNFILSINKENNLIKDSIPSSEIANIKPEHYTNVLKSVHEYLNTYLGQKISFSGYIYRLNGFKEDQFVLARDMDIGNNQTLVVGFLCSYDKVSEFENYSWVTITGEITKGNYNGEIPVLKILSIEKTNKPENSNVCMPDSSFVPTAVIY